MNKSILLLILFIILINLVNAMRNQSTILPPWKKSNSIELLKKLISNRQILTKNNRTLILTSKSSIHNTTQSIALVTSTLNTLNKTTSTTPSNLRLLFSPVSQKIITNNQSSNITALIIVFICCCIGFIFLTLIITFVFRQYVNNSYVKLPCIHLLSTTKQSRNSIPLSYSPIDQCTLKEMGNQQSSRISPKLTHIHRNRSYQKLSTICCTSTKLRRQFSSNLSKTYSFNIPDEFSLDQLYDIYMQKHALDDLAFSMEFKNIPDFDELPCSSATRSIVASKNRFLNILPIDATRVVLNLLDDDPSTDYINGNYISGYKCPKKFIATQGPKPDTCEDFWRMIWELKLKTIVMLTNTVEGALRTTKCHQYWPELNETITYGCYQILCIDKQIFSDYEKRFFQLSKINNDKEVSSSSSTLSNTIDNEQDIRLIVQYHYTKWKDMDVPNYSHTLLHLINDVNEQTKSNEYPIVVHCTAGVGRTGTYIAIDAMLDKIAQEGKIDIFSFVSQMRQERHLMVQTVKQYVFIYRSLLEYYLYGNTRIEGNDFQSIYSNLKKNEQNSLISEYNKLSLLSVENILHHDAHVPENIHKNRHQQIIPYDYNRVFLSRILGHPYINASFIEGYPFIITQDPLPDTIHEFWRMFIEHDSHCIVQLHTVVEMVPKCANYYPDELDLTMKIGSTSLLNLLKRELIENKYILRQFCLTDTRETLSKIIYHYEYLIPITTNDDNEQCIPTILTHHFFDFIGHINKQLDTKNSNRYITVHCGNGGPSCALFCLSFILLDQLKTEHAVDIFQTVRAMQRQRPAMITSFTQYEYLYDLLLKFLDESYDLTTGKSTLSLNNSIYDNEQEYDLKL